MHKAKEYLLTIKKTEDNLLWLEEEIARTYYAALPGGIRYDSDKVQTSPEDRMSSIVIQVMEKTEKQWQEVEKLAKKRRRIIKEICTLPNRAHRIILYGFYVKGRPLRQIAKDESYSYDWILHQHSNALDEFKRLVLDRK